MSDYSESSLVAELRRVASLHPGVPLTQMLFRTESRVSPTTVRRQFGTWADALATAQIADRYSGIAVTSGMRTQAAKGMEDEELLELVRSAARSMENGEPLTKKRFDELNLPVASSALHYRFGGWNRALRLAGVPASRHSKRYTDAQCFEALVDVWTTLGRAPMYREMQLPLSSVTGKAFITRWGTWTRALEAFVESVDQPAADTVIESDPPSVSGRAPRPRSSSDVPPSTRWKVGQRDRWRCVNCGRSPSTDIAVQLHIDHILPRALGGTNDAENLQVLCSTCNLGKGSKRQE